MKPVVCILWKNEISYNFGEAVMRDYFIGLDYEDCVETAFDMIETSGEESLHYWWVGIGESLDDVKIQSYDFMLEKQIMKIINQPIDSVAI